MKGAARCRRGMFIPYLGSGACLFALLLLGGRVFMIGKGGLVFADRVSRGGPEDAGSEEGESPLVARMANGMEEPQPA